MGEILFFRGEDALDDWEKFWGFLGVKNTRTRKGWLQQDCPGTFLVTLGVFIHIQSLHLVVSENSMYCWLVWTKRATICFDDIGCLFVCLKPVVIFPTSLSPSKNHEMWLYRLSSIFIIFILWCLLVLSSFSLFWIIPPSFLMIVYKHSIWADSFGKIKIERTLCSI